MGSSKKRKAAGARDSKPTPKRAKASIKTTKKKVALSDLPWKQVSIVNQMEDAEGFFGLEEVEGVEVLRDEKTGQLSWMTAQELPSDGAGGGENFQTDLELEKNGASEDEKEWTGFDDEENNTSFSEKHEEQPDPRAVKAAAGGDVKGSSFLVLGEKALEDSFENINLHKWQSIGISPEILSAVAEMKYRNPTPIQAASIPEILAGHDVVGKAATGSGKTLAFGIPIFEASFQNPSSISTKKGRKPNQIIALILAPTRELAHQIGDHFTNFREQGGMDRPRIAVVTGGLSIQKQQRMLDTAEVIIGTPGRLWELIEQSEILERLKMVQFLVLDEADRLLSDGHFKELESILTALDKTESHEDEIKSTPGANSRQTLVFSATFNKGLQKKLSSKRNLTMDMLSKAESMEYLLQKLRFREEKPKFIDVDPISQMAEGITEAIVECGGLEKDLYLYSILLLRPRARTLVFANSISAVRRIAPFLQNLNFSAQPLHSNMEQKARLRAIEKFSRTPNSVLVATDVAARGLDIPSVSLIIHYHLPRTADMYVHRSGRTARGEETGTSIVICSPEEVSPFKRLVSKIHEDRSSSKPKVQDLQIDRRVVSKLKERTTLAKKIADVGKSQEVGSSEKDLFRRAAEDLGVEYNSDALDLSKGKRGRGNDRRAKQKENKEVPKAQLAAWRAELKSLLSRRVNVGVSERYIAQGLVDVDALLRGEQGNFLGDASLQ